LSVVVLHISANSYPPLPAVHNTFPIWQELAKGADAYHVVARAEGWRASHTRLGNVHLHLVPSFVASQAEFLVSMWLLLWWGRRIAPTLIVAQCPVLGGIVGALLARWRRVPLFVELHGSHYFPARDRSPKGRLYQWLGRFALARAARIRALTRQMRDDVALAYGDALRARTVVIPTRVDMALFAPEKADYALHGPLRLTAVGAFAPVKNHLGLLEVLARADFPFHLTLVGDGPLRGAYEARVRELGLQASVTLGRWLPQAELVQVLRETDVFLHVSVAEALPRAVLEAMAMALPVVCTDVGFVAEAVEDGVSGLLVPSPVDERLLAALVRLRGAEALRAGLGGAAHATARTRFEWHAAFDAYRAALYGLPGSPGQP
jgi:glycosyltransferase involved in cell wall biosynthesis